MMSRERVGLAVLAAMVAIADVAACGSSNKGTEAGDAEPSGRDAVVAGDALVDMSDDAGSSVFDSPPDAVGVACVPPENDAGTCSTVDVLGGLVTATCSSTEPPQPQGGTIEDGTYVLDAFTHYGGCPTTPDISSTTWSICSNHWDVGQVIPANSANVDAGLVPIFRLNFVATVQGASVSLALACEPTNSSAISLGTRGFTASSTGLTFIYPDPTTDGAMEVSHYARQ